MLLTGLGGGVSTLACANEEGRPLGEGCMRVPSIHHRSLRERSRFRSHTGAFDSVAGKSSGAWYDTSAVLITPWTGGRVSGNLGVGNGVGGTLPISFMPLVMLVFRARCGELP